MEIEQKLDYVMSFLGTESWVIQVFAVVFVTLLAAFIQKRVFTNLARKLSQTRIYWDDAMVTAMQTPLNVLIWLLGLCFAAEIVQAKSGAAIFGAIDPIRDIGVIVIIAWFLVRFIRLAEDNILNYSIEAGDPIDRTTADAIAKLLRISVIITAVLIIMQYMGYSISGVLAFGGIGGIAIGFAAKDLLANFFGGLMIYLDRPFNVGDWIRSPDREIEGVVENIGWRLTTIRTFDKRPLYLPNAIFTSIAVENPSRMKNRRIKETVGIRYSDANKMAAITRDVKKMLQDHPEIDTNQALIVNFNTFAPSSLDFFVYTLTKTTDWHHFHEVKEDVLLKVIEIIESHGAECAFPTSTIHLVDSEPEPAPAKT
ncbi:MAG: mechanosensitive ion channel family protein [Gammaproteobacteria bacterium]|nr:mechanosensitive ion channel family protein [Gammaproteobacteria bacterium]